MSLRKRWRVAIGCGCLAALGSVALLGSVGWRLYAGLRENQEKAALRARVASVPFEIPPDGVVPEDRLRLFLEVCRRTTYVDAKYSKERESLERGNARGELSLGGLAGTVAYIDELKMARAQALSDLGMGMREFRWMILSLGETPWDAPLDSSLPDLQPRGAETDRKNAATFQRHLSEIGQCFNASEMARVRQGLKGYREDIRKGSE